MIYYQNRWDEGDPMVLSYNKLWKLLIDKNIKKTELKEMTGIGSTTLSKLSKNQVVSMEVLLKICDKLECNIGDIVDALPNERSGETYDRSANI